MFWRGLTALIASRLAYSLFDLFASLLSIVCLKLNFRFGSTEMARATWLTFDNGVGSDRRDFCIIFVNLNSMQMNWGVCLSGIVRIAIIHRNYQIQHKRTESFKKQAKVNWYLPNDKRITVQYWQSLIVYLMGNKSGWKKRMISNKSGGWRAQLNGEMTIAGKKWASMTIA